jgi:hypothetical protein
VVVDFGLCVYVCSSGIGTNVWVYFYDLIFSSGCSSSYSMFLLHCEGCLVRYVWAVS